MRQHIRHDVSRFRSKQTAFNRLYKRKIRSSHSFSSFYLYVISFLFARILAQLINTQVKREVVVTSINEFLSPHFNVQKKSESSLRGLFCKNKASSCLRMSTRVWNELSCNTMERSFQPRGNFLISKQMRKGQQIT